MRWWSWALRPRDRKAEPVPASTAVTMVPVRVVPDEFEAFNASGREGRGSVAWTLRSSRGEIVVYSAGEHAGDLHAALALLIGGGP